MATLTDQITDYRMGQTDDHSIVEKAYYFELDFPIATKQKWRFFF